MKNGFTLIELMMVIVIIGILAAIAVPKIFGMSARAKASEIGTAAGTYKRLQEAYFMEANALGDQDQVGYESPISQNMTYEIANTSPYAFTASVNTGKALNSACLAGNTWTLTPAINPGIISWTIGGTAGCLALTPNFAALATN